MVLERRIAAEVATETISGGKMWRRHRMDADVIRDDEFGTRHPRTPWFGMAAAERTARIADNQHAVPSTRRRQLRSGPRLLFPLGGPLAGHAEDVMRAMVLTRAGLGHVESIGTDKPAPKSPDVLVKSFCGR